MSTSRTVRHRPRRGGPGLAAACAGLLLASACKSTFNDIIAVDPADRVSESALFGDPAQAGLLVSSVQAQFECALGTYAVSTGLLSNELNSLGSTQMFSLDSHQPDPAGGFSGQYAVTDCTSAGSVGVYIPMSSARWFADQVLGALQGWTDAQVTGRTALIAAAAAYSGYAHVLLGEGFCSMALDAGPELTPVQMFGKAEEKFALALTSAQAAGGAVGTDFLNMAHIGRARARIDQNKTADALADAQAAPATGYVKDGTRSAGSTLRENQVWVNVNRSGAATVGPDYIDVTWLGQPDPRVGTVFQGITLGFPRYTITKYTSESSPIAIATSAEAQLIIAEVVGGQQAVDIINALHTAAGIGPFASTDAAEIRAQVIEERRRQFFLDGHRLFDKIRFNVPLDPAPGAPYRWGGVHGSAKCMPLPDVERNNNPNA
ncbi:MAG: RagB/SusD family nutrient uptake outer membrane protein [Gemmatimonadota bacterium]